MTRARGWAALALVAGACGTEPVPGQPATAVRLTETATPSRTFLNNAKCVAASAGRVHVAWVEVLAAGPGFDAPPAQGQLFYRRSLDGGASFAAALALTAEVADVSAPKLAADGDRVLAVWHQRDGQRFKVYATRSDDGGASWHPPAPIGEGSFPSLDLGGGSAHVVWNNPQVASGISEIYLASSGDGGGSFAAPLRVSSDDGYSSWTASVAAAGSLVHVAWTDERHDLADCGAKGGGPDCREEEYYRRSRDGGATFGEPEVRLTTDTIGMPAPSWCPSIVAEGNDVHVAWFDHKSGDWEVYRRRSRDGGATWDGAVSLTSALGAPSGQWLRPSLAVRGARAQLAFWVLTLDGERVWTVASTDGGDSWGPPLLMSSASPARHPAVALDADGATHIAWYEPADGNDEMFYRRLDPP